MTRVYLSVSSDLRPNELTFKDLDAYFAAWRNALVKELRAYKAAALYCAQAIRARFRAETRFLATHPRSTATINKTNAHRAWWRNLNAERMAHHWPAH
jgi:hypothetical protein